MHRILGRAVSANCKHFQPRTTIMPDLKDGESAEVQGSARTPYILKNVGGVYSCTCPAWRNQSVSIERRTCKHLRGLSRRTGGTGPAGLSGPGSAEGRQRGRGHRTEAAAGPSVGERYGPDRLVDEREARRRAGLVGRPAVSFAAGQRLSCSRTGSSPACPACRSTANCGSTARRSSAP